MPGMNRPFNLHTALTAWQSGPFSIAVAVALVGLAYWYLRADWRLAARGRRWPGRRTLAFMAGLLAVDVALQSPVATFTGSYFEAHVTQHLLLMVVAPPLLALGAPSTLLLQSSSRQVKTKWLAILRSRPFAVATYPMIVWFFYFGVMFAFFLSPLINYAMEHMALMDAINVAFLLGGCMYWWPVVGLDPIVHWRMGYGTRLAALSIGVPFEAFLGVAIMSLRTPIASMYSLSSTHSGGALLWAATELAIFVGLIPIFLQWMRADERAGARADARANRAARAQERSQIRPVEPVSAALSSQTASSGSVTVERFRPLFQPGNSSWEELWKAKAGFVPSTSSRPDRSKGGTVPRGDTDPRARQPDQGPPT
jgi:cytochrome c oxidase assembly factor CtaG